MSTIKKENTVSLESIREQALKDAAQSVKSIRLQKQSEPVDTEELNNALRNSEEAMFFLAIHAGNDDETITGQILDRYELSDLK